MDVLVEVALASPGVCALRALHTVADGMDFDHPVLLTSAAKIAAGFRTLWHAWRRLKRQRRRAAIVRAAVAPGMSPGAAPFGGLRASPR